MNWVSARFQDCKDYSRNHTLSYDPKWRGLKVLLLHMLCARCPW